MNLYAAHFKLYYISFYGKKIYSLRPFGEVKDGDNLFFDKYYEMLFSLETMANSGPVLEAENSFKFLAPRDINQPDMPWFEEPDGYDEEEDRVIPTVKEWIENLSSNKDDINLRSVPSR